MGRLEVDRGRVIDWVIRIEEDRWLWGERGFGGIRLGRGVEVRFEVEE